MLARIQATYKLDRGELQRYWESSEMYLQLVMSMCEALKWDIMKRLLHSLSKWFKSRIPKSFACFLHEEDRIPFPCLQLLAENKLTVRDIAEMNELMLVRQLRIGMSGKFRMNPIDYTKIDKDAVVTSFIVKPQKDYERFLADMERIAHVLKQRAQERQTALGVNRVLRAWEKESEISVLVSPLVTEKEAMLNAIENEQSDGERSTGVLSVSDESTSEAAEESENESEPKRVQVCSMQEFDANWEEAKRREQQWNPMTFGACQHFCAEDTLGSVDDQDLFL